MDIKTPDYNGKFDDMVSGKENAILWMRQQILEAVKESRSIIRDFVSQHIEDVGLLSTSVQYAKAGYGQPRLCYYVWRVGQDPNKRFGEKRIVMRKDGTINMASVREGVEFWAEMQMSRANQDRVKNLNREMMEREGVSSTSEFDVGPDANKEGVCLIRLRRYHRFVKTAAQVEVKIHRAEDYMAAMSKSLEAMNSTIVDCGPAGGK